VIVAAIAGAAVASVVAVVATRAHDRTHPAAAGSANPWAVGSAEPASEDVVAPAVDPWGPDRPDAGPVRPGTRVEKR
jgi:hypothetical protein